MYAAEFRDRYHSFRKAIIRGVDDRWPKTDVGPFLDTLHIETKAPYSDEEPEVLPDQARDFLAEWRKTQDIEALYRVSEPCTVDPKMGILFHKGRVLWGSSDQPLRERSPRFLSHLKSGHRTLASAILLHHVHGDNYFHFLLYVMSRVELVERLGLPTDIPFLVPERTAETAFFKRAQELGAFGAREIVVQGKREVVLVESPYLVRAFFCQCRVFDWLADKLGAPAPSKDAAPLFVVRRANAANGRTFRNQAEMDDVARSLGFETIDPGDHLLEKQVEIFQHAPIVAGPHGAGLTNVLFRSKKPGGLVEIFNPGMGSPHYYMVARERGFSYDSFFAINPIGRAFSASTEVDLDTLRESLETALEVNQRQTQ
ncbi:glycosyltransferase family 61 protein [Roseibium sediminis]|uniref:glycosyltransferase family 61 protein n=1 Tax=Roseibium sediminis TaxID=1775174 RepID=UPI001AD8CB57|nr:glycosyltransferase 61 family protein [Roseibium sediminis]